MLVLDASVLANVVGDDGDDGYRTRTIMRGADLAAVPDLAYVETMSVLRRRWRAGDLDDDRISAAVEDLASLALKAYPAGPLLPRAFDLRHNVTPYDACYVALAEALDCPLVTADAKLARAPSPTCQMHLVG